MTKHSNTLSIPAIEQELRRSLAAMEAASDETAAAKAYSSLKSGIETFILRTAELRNEFYKIKNTVTQQAHTLAEIELAETIGLSSRPAGEKAPGEAKNLQTIAPDFPETLTIQQSPDFFFIRLSYGLVNIRHIVELDVKSKTLHTVNSTRHLAAGDVRILLFHLKMYRP